VYFTSILSLFTTIHPQSDCVLIFGQKQVLLYKVDKIPNKYANILFQPINSGNTQESKKKKKKKKKNVNSLWCLGLATLKLILES
jgi:hypothetical protein